MERHGTSNGTTRKLGPTFEESVPTEGRRPIPGDDVDENGSIGMDDFFEKIKEFFEKFENDMDALISKIKSLFESLPE